MKCPRCGKPLAHETYEGVAVDVCLSCGVWLDAGELERIIGTREDTFNYNYSTGIILDSCPHGHGAWLDKGELERVQIHMEHWDREAPKQKGDWQKIMAKTSGELADREVRARQARRAMLGPAGRVLESALNALVKIPGQP